EPSVGRPRAFGEDADEFARLQHGYRVVERVERGAAALAMYRDRAEPVHHPCEELALDAGKVEVVLLRPVVHLASDDPAKKELVRDREMVRREDCTARPRYVG